jgi:hypothetical protein
MATQRKAAGSISDEVTVSVSLRNPSSRTVALGSAQPVTEMNTRNLPGLERGRRVGLTTTLPSMTRLFRQCGIIDISQPYRPPLPVTGIALLYGDGVCFL